MRLTRAHRAHKHKTDALMEKVSSELIISRNDYFFFVPAPAHVIKHTHTRREWESERDTLHTQRLLKGLKLWAKSEHWTISLLLVMTANERARERASECDKNPMKLRTMRASFITHLQTKRTIYILYSNICSLRSEHLKTHAHPAQWQTAREEKILIKIYYRK